MAELPISVSMADLAAVGKVLALKAEDAMVVRFAKLTGRACFVGLAGSVAVVLAASIFAPE